MLDAVAADIIVAPHCLESGAQAAEFVHAGAHLRRSACADRIRPKDTRHEPGDAFPIELRGADAGIEADEAQDIALLRRERSVVGQHRDRGAVPRDDVPWGGLHQGRAEFKRVHSFFKVFNCSPPVFGFSSIGAKDSLRNTRETRVFVWNLAALELAESMNATAASVPYEADEFELAGTDADHFPHCRGAARRGKSAAIGSGQSALGMPWSDRSRLPSRQGWHARLHADLTSRRPGRRGAPLAPEIRPHQRADGAAGHGAGYRDRDAKPVSQSQMNKARSL